MRFDDENYEYGSIYKDEANEYVDDEESKVFEYPEDDNDDENALWYDEDDTADTDIEIELTSKAQRQIAKEKQLIDELEAEAKENPIEDEQPDEDSERKKLKRELQAEALARLEDAARTLSDFEKVIAWWDKLDANRERKERYHELSRSGDDIPLDYGAAKDGLFFPDTLNGVLEKQIRKGDFLDAIFYCPYDIHELVTEENLSVILKDLTEEHKELLFLCAVRAFSSTWIATIRGQTDRNIRKVRGTMLKKIRKKLLPTLMEKAKQQPLTLLEKEFLAENSEDIENSTK